MAPNIPPWLDRWLQTDDDELLYVDQTLLIEGGLTIEEQMRLDAAQERRDLARDAFYAAQMRQDAQISEIVAQEEQDDDES